MPPDFLFFCPDMIRGALLKQNPYKDGRQRLSYKRAAMFVAYILVSVLDVCTDQ